MSKLTVLSVFIGLLSTIAKAVVIVTTLPNLGVPLGPEGSFSVDLDGNGSHELTFMARSGVEFSVVSSSNTRIQAIKATPPNLGSSAWPLVIGDTVGPTPKISSVWLTEPIGSSLRACTDLFCVGHWPNGIYTIEEPGNGVILYPESGFLGVEFTNDSGLHYGWVNVGVISFSPTGRVYGWGWESQANLPVTIAVPEPSTFILLSLGFVAVAMFHRKYSRLQNNETKGKRINRTTKAGRTSRWR